MADHPSMCYWTVPSSREPVHCWSLGRYCLYYTPTIYTAPCDRNHYAAPSAARFRLRICQQSHAATKADTPPSRKMKPIASFDAAGTWTPALARIRRTGSLAASASCVSGTGEAMKAKTTDDMNDVTTAQDAEISFFGHTTGRQTYTAEEQRS